MTIQLTIPDTIARALRLPDDDIAQELKVELAVALYGRQILGFGKARELANLTKLAFGLLLGQRRIPRHYDESELDDDLRYARSQ